MHPGIPNPESSDIYKATVSADYERISKAEHTHINALRMRKPVL